MAGLILPWFFAFFLHAAAGKPAGNPQQPGAALPRVTPAPRAYAQGSLALGEYAANHSWLALESALKDSADPGAGFYRGLLLSHLGQYEGSRQLLEPLLATLAAGSDRTREKQARLALAGDYFRTFRYKEAAEQFAALNKCCTGALDVGERREVELPTRLLPLLAGAAPQTLELSGGFTVPLRRNVLGLRDVEVFVDGHPSRWIFDPAANFTMLSRSQARRIGLKLMGSDDLAGDAGSGAPLRIQAAVIPQLKIGAAFFRNVPVAVYADEDLYDDSRRYQTEGILAQPLLAALGAVTASDDDHLTVMLQAPLSEGAPLFSDAQQLLVGAGAKGAEQLYAIDPAVANSVLSYRFYREHAADFAGQAAKAGHLPGLSPEVPVYMEETLTLEFGDVFAALQELPVLAKPGEGDRFYGRLGADALDQLASYTFDFRSMRFIARVHTGQ